MKIALLSPKGPLYRCGEGIWKRSLRYAPLTLTTLASLIPRDIDSEIMLFDEGIESIPLDLDVDLVGITVITGSAPRAYTFAKHYRSKGIPVVLGGPHVTLVPDDAAPHADAIVTGYAEDTWPQLLRDFVAGHLQPQYNQNPDLSLAGRPIPRRDLLKARHYLTTNTFEATRGCIHGCDFCVVPSAWGRSPYQKPVEEIIFDIRQYGARRVIFLDLNLVANIKYARTLFEALIPLNIQWYGLSTTLFGRDSELMALAARSGCKGLLLGFETLSQDNLDHAGKAFTSSDDYRFVIEQVHRHGIGIQGCFVFGMDHDTPEVFEQTAAFVIETGIELPRFAIRTPFPGTKLYHRLEAEDRILTKDWELYDSQHVVFQPASMSVEELQAGHLKAWKQAYSYSAIRQRFGRKALSNPVLLAANLGYRYYVKRLHQLCAPSDVSAQVLRTHTTRTKEQGAVT